MGLNSTSILGGNHCYLKVASNYKGSYRKADLLTDAVFEIVFIEIFLIPHPLAVGFPPIPSP
jgi:hypothetical protein